MIPPLYESWYFARPGLAAQFLALLLDGTGDPLVLMGERRVGKTLFLLNDLVPAAQERNFRIVYVDLWQHRAQPLEAINYALQDTLDDIEVPAGKVGRRLATAVKKIGLAGGSIDLGEAPMRRRPTDPALLVDWLLKQLIIVGRKPVLLIFDEVQELAYVPAGEAIVSSLRAALTRQRKFVRVIFTGSSEEGLRALLSRSRAALYEGASTLSFPHLDESFLRFLIARVKTRFSRRIEFADCSAAFERLHYRPRAMIDLILLFLSKDSTSMVELVGQQLEAYLLEHDYAAQWQALKPLERLLCQTILAGRAVTSGAERLHLAKHMQLPARTGGVPPGTIAKALRALQAEHIIARRGGARGSYRLDDPVFAEWIRRQGDSDGQSATASRKRRH